MNFLPNSLINNSKLKKLNLSHNRDVTAVGWQAFLAVFQSPNSALEKFSLCGISIDDISINYLSNPLANNNKLKELNLSCNLDVSATGWQTFSAVLWNPNSALEKLCLRGNFIND